ncbi:hypothetical protein CDL15_Pgr006998 [Punica granatum]|uniref:Bet1-like protein At4g14600 n=1 Tax=Punica granatum TaxID=22663 RepID=A0A218X7N5_PUNGR|nr:hypothetical protein CDL15_Pgr006998 [Punica granatum]
MPSLPPFQPLKKQRPSRRDRFLLVIIFGAVLGSAEGLVLDRSLRDGQQFQQSRSFVRRRLSLQITVSQSFGVFRLPPAVAESSTCFPSNAVLLNSYTFREGLSTRPVGGSDEIQLQIDPMHGDLDDEIGGLRNQVRQLRNQMIMIKAEAGVKNNVRRLNKSIVQYGSRNVMHVIAFALLVFFIVYMLSKMSRR